MPTLSTLYRHVVERPAFLAHLARLGIPLYVSHIPAVTLEMTNACNLRCPVCPVPSIKRKKGFMAEEDLDNYAEVSVLGQVDAVELCRRTPAA